MLSSILLVIFIFCGIRAGECLKCYSCNSMLNERCGDPIDPDELETMDCTPFSLAKAAATIGKGIEHFGGPSGDLKFACQKIDVTVSDGGVEDAITLRSCAVANVESLNPCAMTDYFVKVTGGKGEVKFCDTCESDLCNGSSRQTFATILLAVPCFAMFFVDWFNV